LPKWYVFDSESDELALPATVIWCTCVTDFHTGEMWFYPPGDEGWKSKLEEADRLIGHNIVQHDFPLYKRLANWEPRPDQEIHDSLIMSRFLDYNRFPSKKHSMEVWAEALGKKKQEHEDWSQFSEEMKSRCITDTLLNVEMYEVLLEEYNSKKSNNPNLPVAMACEHYAAKWSAMGHINGWPFDKTAGLKLKSELETVIANAEKELQPKLGMKAVAVDKVKGEVEVKRAKWTQAGCYHSHTASWFGVNPWSGFDGEIRPVIGSYCRLDLTDLRLGSTDDVKIFLYRQGWVPFEWNTKKVEGERKPVRTSPKITEDSLEFLGGDGKLYREYSVASSRLSILKNWLEGLDEDDRVHGDCICIGTPSMRARHQIIVNIPSMESKWGPEMRALFTHKPGWTLIGADSSGNQGRGLAWYLKDAVYTDVILNKDIHAYNAGKLDKVITGMGISWSEYFIKNKLVKTKGHVKRFLEKKGFTDADYFRSNRKVAKKAIAKAKRARAKRVYYSFLFGAGGPKMWGYCFGTPDEQKGGVLKTGFTKNVPGLTNLLNRLDKEWQATKKAYGYRKGFITAISGNRIYVDSKHKELVYLLQAFEKATCAAAIYVLMTLLEEHNIPYEPHIFMHDEVDFSVPDEYVELAKELSTRAFAEGPMLFDIEIMAGEAKSGRNWREIH